jgi:hypothetical protein
LRIAPGAQRDELRRDPVHPDAQGPLNPLKHQIDIADLQDTRGLFATPPCVDLITEQTFDDFQLHVEFKYPPGSNSGLYLRGRYEVQIQDDKGIALDPLRIGGAYGFLAPTANAGTRQQRRSAGTTDDSG